MKTYILLLTCLMAASFGHAMNPVAANPMSQKENEDFFADCENIVDIDMSDLPEASPTKLVLSPSKMFAAAEQRAKLTLDLDTLFVNPKPSPSKSWRAPLAPLAHSVLAKRVLFPETQVDVATTEPQATQVVTHGVSQGPKKARTELPYSSQKKTYECPECGKHFNHNTELSNHILSHRGLKPFACPGCDKKFAQKNQRKAHMQRLHPEIAIPSESVAIVYDPSTYPKDKFPHSCSVCNKGFQDERSLSRHKIGMQYNESHQQLENQQKLNSSSLLPIPKIPAVFQNEEVSQIPVVQRESMALSTSPTPPAIVLPIDIQLEKNEKIKKHVCTECGEKFARLSTFEDHINLHKGTKPYECPHCDKRFVQRGNRNAHIKTKHKGLKIPHEKNLVIHDAQAWSTDIYPHRCTACNKGFSRPVGLYHHLRHMSTNTAHQELEQQQKHNTPLNSMYPCTKCGQNFCTRIAYVDHSLDNKCTPLATAKTVDSDKQAAPVSTPADKPQLNTDEKKLYICPVSSCKKECHGAAEYGAHVSSHYLANYSTNGSHV